MYLADDMGNHYFKFKQFTIQQDQCAMKVCTDACLFGALVANRLSQKVHVQDAVHCLDIGTGTGVLALMLAQKNPQVQIDLVEIDADAAKQATENITSSPWFNRLHIYNADILEFLPDKTYDYILTNPPFFEADLKSPDKVKNKAKHDTSLSLKQVLLKAENFLSAQGTLAVLLAYRQVNGFIEEAAKLGLYPNRQILVKQTGKHPYFRGILFFSRQLTISENIELIIKDAEGHYTKDFTEALADYYLFL